MPRLLHCMRGHRERDGGHQTRLDHAVGIRARGGRPALHRTRAGARLLCLHGRARGVLVLGTGTSRRIVTRRAIGNDRHLHIAGEGDDALHQTAAEEA